MNQNRIDFRLISFMHGPEGWGRAAATTIRATVMARLGGSPAGTVFRVNLGGVRRMDVTFATEVIVLPIKAFLGTRPVCLVDPIDLDITENIAAAAERNHVPVTIWSGNSVQVVGLQPGPGTRDILDYALKRDDVRASDLAHDHGLSITNASTRLKQLCERGYLMREEHASPSGGSEFVYKRIG